MLTLKVNIRAQEEKERKEKERIAKETISKIQASTGPPSKARKRKGLNFHEPGTFVAKGEQLRKKAKLEALQKKIAATAAKTGINDAVKLATLTTSKVLDKRQSIQGEDVDEEVPDIEWWDKILLRSKALDEVILRLGNQNTKPEEIFDGITNLVEHPPIKDPPVQDQSVAQVPIFLTKKERKKLRRQGRKNMELEKQEQIKLGLMPKPEPKLKRSNIMYALANEAIVNPSMAEQLVREQEEKRKQAHLEHNESKKLSLEEKRSKKLRKIQEDLSVTGTWVAVYRVLDLSHQAHRFKVTQNAKQLTMSGTLVLYKDINLVVVEGGPKQQRKFKNLMLNRIRWAEDSSTIQNGETRTISSNRCLLVWEGQVNQRFFRGFKAKQMSSVTEAREYLQQFKAEHYWDLAFKMSILESIEDN